MELSGQTVKSFSSKKLARDFSNMLSKVVVVVVVVVIVVLVVVVVVVVVVVL